MGNKPANGLILKGIGGFYYVEAGGVITECKARGIFRNRGLVPLAGDIVEFDPDQGVINEICERKNSFLRPPVANVDNFVIVVSTMLPKPDLLVIDKLTVIARSEGISPIIAVTKCDEVSGADILSIYAAAGFTVLDCSFGSGSGIEKLKTLISSGITVFTGNSGAGKSSLLNRIIAGLEQPTQQSSERLGRGRHTTREVSLFRFEGGYIADTPGFSSVSVNGNKPLTAEKLPQLFPDIARFTGGCRFVNCSHISEKGCSVLEALGEGRIQPSRHLNYAALRSEMGKINPWE